MSGGVGFIGMLRKAMDLHESAICCGLDPDVDRLPREFAGRRHEEAIAQFLQGVIEETAPIVCCYKIQKAYFDIHADGHALLLDVIAMIRKAAPDVPIMMDAKTGDIDQTMRAYVHLFLDEFGVDAVMVNPYMGSDVWAPLQARNAGIVTLVRTSNPSARELQSLECGDGRPLWRHVLDQVVGAWDEGAEVMPVMAATWPEDLVGIRDLVPAEMPIFIAGVGPQGGAPSSAAAAQSASRNGLVVNAARAMLYPVAADEDDWRSAVRDAADHLRRAVAEIGMAA